MAALSAGTADAVVEIGPGRGALTRAILAAGIPVIAIEIDRVLAAALRTRFDGPSLRLIEADVLSLPLASIGDHLVVVGNLPYNISKPIAMKLVDERRCVARAVLMFQREVADRLTAGAGAKDYGPLTVLAGRAFKIERLFQLPPGAFRPSPKVVSTVTLWTPRPADDLPDALVPALKATLRAAFAHRRQTIQKNLRQELAEDEATVRRLLAEASIDGAQRAEALSPEQFVRLATLVGRRTV